MPDDVRADLGTEGKPGVAVPKGGEVGPPNGVAGRPWAPPAAGQALQTAMALDDLSSISSPFPPIADYAFLSDCDVTALVAPSGNVEWMCLPRMDSPSVFGAILDRAAGGFRFGPTDVAVPAAPRYLPGTMVLATSWSADGGWVIVRDVLLMGPWHHERAVGDSHRRAPTDYEAEHTLLRTVRCVNGEVQLTIDCEPAFDYGRERAQWRYTDKGYFQGIAEASGVSPALTLTSDIRLGFEGPRASARTLIKQGESPFCALTSGDFAAPLTFQDAYNRLVCPAAHWQPWPARGHLP